MDWMMGLQNAIDYIEENLTEELNYTEIARQACSSNFHFQRVFGILCGCTLGEYIRSRRLTLAGGELAGSKAKVIDVALRYGYDSPESFSRAFTRFHGVTPIQARNHPANLKSFSRLSVKYVLEGGTTMNYRVEKREAFLIAAKKKRFSGKEEIRSEQIHQAWRESGEDGTFEALCRVMDPESPLGSAMLGICFDDPNAGDFDYAIGAAYGSGELAEGLTLEKIPAATWVAFPCSGAMPEAFLKLWKQIYTEYFPASKYQPSGMCIEVYYDDRVDSKDYHCEMWLSVTEKEK